MGRGLSQQQKAILRIIGNSTVNIYADLHKPLSELDSLPDTWHAYARYRGVAIELYGLAEYRRENPVSELSHFPGHSALQPDALTPSQRVSFSRAVDSLMKRSLLEGLALAWVIVGKERYSSGGGEFWRWEGRGPRVLNHQFDVYDDTPRLKMLSLTETGWKLAYDLWPDLMPLEIPYKQRRRPKRKQVRKWPKPKQARTVKAPEVSVAERVAALKAKARALVKARTEAKGAGKS